MTADRCPDCGNNRAGWGDVSHCPVCFARRNLGRTRKGYRDVEGIARAFHDTYERLAPDFGYKTREESAVPWDQVPSRNRILMIATVEALIERGVIL